MSQGPDLGAMFGGNTADTFLGLPRAETSGGSRAALLGVPVMTPYASVGSYCRNAPRAIREVMAAYSASLAHIDFDQEPAQPLFEDPSQVADCGDLPFHESDFAANRARLTETVATLLNAGTTPVLVGGDDSVPIPMHQAYEGRGKFVVVQVDAHIDWRDEVQGERFGLSSNMRRAAEMPHIEKIIQIGRRGMGSARPADDADARAWGVEFFSAREVARAGIGPALAAVPAGSEVLFALDIDGLDPSVVPGVIGRSPGGLGYWELIELMHGVAAKAHLAGFSLVEFVPESDVDNLGALVCGRIIANALSIAARSKI